MAISPGLGAAFDLDWLDRLADDGVDTLQVREKHLDDRDLLRLVRRVVQRVGAHRKGRPGTVRLRVLVNGRADVADLADADGVHLPARGVPTAAVRRRFPRLLVGRSTHTVDELCRAADGGADYVTFSPIRATPSKDRFGPPQGFDALREAVRAAGDLPVVALGGLDGDDVNSIRDAGACGLAGIRVFRDDEERRRLCRAWHPESDRSPR